MARRSTSRGRFGPILAAVLACSTLAVLASASPAIASVFNNANPVTFNDPFNGDCIPPNGSGASTPYPATIAVSGLTGTVSKVTATLKNVSSTFAPDMDILLVAPSGAALILVSDAGGTNPGSLTNVTVTFDDAAGSVLPNSPPAVSWGAPNSTVTSRPVDYDFGADADAFPSPAPASFNSPAPGGVATLASSFNGINPNGTWSLYAVDDGCNQGDVGGIAGGWSLDITTAAAVTATSTTLGSAPDPSTTGQSVLFTATVTSGGSPVTTGTVTFAESATILAANVSVSGGVATFSKSDLPEGDHTITATYNGTATLGISNASVNQRADNATTNPNTGMYCNTGAITIPSDMSVTPAVPYPSHITVGSFAGNVGKVTAQLRNVTHGFSEDIDVLLVGPTTSNNLLLVSDAPQNVSAGVTNVTVTFDDAAPSTLPPNAGWGAPSSSVTAKPTDFDPLAAVDTFPAPAPALSGSTTLAAAFNGTNPNGQWSLYVVDDGIGDAGTITGGWCITLTPDDTTPPTVTINQAAGQADPTSGSPINFTATFSEAVTGFTGADVAFTGSTAPGSLVANVTGAGPSYNVAVSGTTGTGTVIASIPAGRANDLAGNPNTASTSTDNTVKFVLAHQSLPGVVTTSTNWALRDSLTSGSATNTFTLGVRTPALTPVIGDWDGDGVKTAGYFQSGVFHLRNSNSAGSDDLTFTFGNPRGFPVSGDFNGDGLDDVALFFSGTWQTRLTGSGATDTFNFGPALKWPTVVPVAGDWDGDGTDGIGFYYYCVAIPGPAPAPCPGATGQWNLRQTASGAGVDLAPFVYNPGTNPYPVVGDWDANGTDTVGVKTDDPANNWKLNNQNDASAPEVNFTFGVASNNIPVVWAQVTQAG